MVGSLIIFGVISIIGITITSISQANSFKLPSNEESNDVVVEDATSNDEEKKSGMFTVNPDDELIHPNFTVIKE